MNYYRTLAFELRQRKLSEKNVAEALREVQQLERVSDRTAEELFGQPRDYAGRYQKESHRSAGYWLLVSGLVLNMAVVFAYLALRLGGSGISTGPVPLIVWAALAVVLGGIAGILVDRRLPKEFHCSL